MVHFNPLFLVNFFIFFFSPCFPGALKSFFVFFPEPGQSFFLMRGGVNVKYRSLKNPKEDLVNLLICKTRQQSCKVIKYEPVKVG